MSCFLGIDAGTSGIKAIVLDDAGKTHGTGYRECNLITTRPGWVEEDPQEWWTACYGAVAEAVSRSGRGKDILSIGFSGQMQGSTLLGADGEPVDNCIIWMDQRAAAQADMLNGRMNAAEMLDETANFCLPSYWAPKLLWLKENKPEVFDRIKKVVFTKDYLRYRMTGEIATEVSDASCSFLLDMKGRRWSDKMFEITGLPRDIVPERLLESQDVAGYLKPDLAAELGLNPGIPVVAGGGDQPAGGVGIGVIKTGIIAATIGTSGVVFGCCDTPFIDEQRRAMFSLCHSVPDKYCFLGCTLGAGGSFKWMRDTFFTDQKERMSAAGQDIYDYMTALAAKVTPGSEGLVFLPYLNGESTPHVDPDARGVFFGLSLRHDLGALCRSVMEGVTYSLRDTIEILRAFGLNINEVRAMGGGAKSALWRQMQADIYNASVVTMNIEEGPAAGAAMMAAVGAGCFKSIQEACDAILKRVSITEPIVSNVSVYDEYYQTYRSLYGSLKNDFSDQARRVREFMK
jgi:xylulokinase